MNTAQSCHGWQNIFSARSSCHSSCWGNRWEWPCQRPWPTIQHTTRLPWQQQSLYPHTVLQTVQCTHISFSFGFKLRLESFLTSLETKHGYPSVVPSYHVTPKTPSPKRPPNRGAVYHCLSNQWETTLWYNLFRLTEGVVTAGDYCIQMALKTHSRLRYWPVARPWIFSVGSTLQPGIYFLPSASMYWSICRRLC